MGWSKGRRSQEAPTRLFRSADLGRVKGKDAPMKRIRGVSEPPIIFTASGIWRSPGSYSRQLRGAEFENFISDLELAPGPILDLWHLS